MSSILTDRDAVFNTVWSSATQEVQLVTLPAGGTSFIVGRGTPGLLTRGWISVVIGTGATGIQLRCRIGSLTGTQVGQTITHTGLTAGSTYAFPLGFLDNTSNLWDTPAGIVYQSTGQQTGAPTGAATTQAFNISVESLL